MKFKRTVMVLFEGESPRDVAVNFCDSLIGKFWAHCTFDIHWCAADELSEDEKRKEATRKAAEADLLVFALEPDGQVPWHLDTWVHEFISVRGEREGVMVGLLESDGQKHRFLREAAHRAGLDYLTQMPENLWRPIPDSLDSYAERAVEVTSVLDGILKQPFRPARPE